MRESSPNCPKLHQLPIIRVYYLIRHYSLCHITKIETQTFEFRLIRDPYIPEACIEMKHPETTVMIVLLLHAFADDVFSIYCFQQKPIHTVRMCTASPPCVSDGVFSAH